MGCSQSSEAEINVSEIAKSIGYSRRGFIMFAEGPMFTYIQESLERLNARQNTNITKMINFISSRRSNEICPKGKYYINPSLEIDDNKFGNDKIKLLISACFPTRADGTIEISCDSLQRARNICLNIYMELGEDYDRGGGGASCELRNQYDVVLDGKTYSLTRRGSTWSYENVIIGDFTVAVDDGMTTFSWEDGRETDMTSVQVLGEYVKIPNDVVEILKRNDQANTTSKAGGNNKGGQKWKSTGRKVMIKTKQGKSSEKTVYVNVVTKEERIRKLRISKDMSRKFVYVKF
jgi:hypothetical protein